MSFIVVSLIVAIACSAITIKTLVGYSNLSLWLKVLISLGVIASWLAPAIVGFMRRKTSIDGVIYNYISDIGYYFFGLAFIVLTLILFRDLVWYIIFGFGKLFSITPTWLNPKNIHSLKIANIAVVFLIFALSAYAVYEAVRLPDIKYVEFASSKLKHDIKIVQLSDLHIDRATSPAAVKKIVDKTNAQNPDIIALTGDVVDDNIDILDSQLLELKKLKATHGVYYVTGNHELYSGLNQSLSKMRNMGINVLFNWGIKIEDLNVFISGIPDNNTSGAVPYFAVDWSKATHGISADNYKVLLSHYPIINSKEPMPAFDLQLSGHTHGGQIFPFSYLAGKVNKYLAGSYKVGDMDLYVSRGTGYWGPPLRLFAPSEITSITIKAK